MRRLATMLLGLATALTITTASAVAAPSPAPSGSGGARTASGDTSGKLLLMLDASGSMLEPDPSGLTKMQAAQKALTSVVGALPSTAQVGLRVYGATVVGGTPTPEACADTQLVHPIDPLDKAGLTAAIAAFVAKGETPIAHSLEKAIEDLGPTGKRNIVLVSDGKESCVPDPCPVVQKLLAQGIDLQIDTVGFAVDDTARRQLQCIADAGHGTYYDAADAAALSASLGKLATRAGREFAIAGTPIDGTTEESGAPTLSAGLWTDTLTTGVRKHYVLKRTIPYSTMRVAVSARPTVDPTGTESSTEVIRFDGVPTHDGEVTSKFGGCSSLPGMASRIGLSSLRSVVSDALLVDGGTAEEPSDCGADQLPFWVSRDEGGKDPLRVEILVIEEPPLAHEQPSASPEPEPTPTPVAPEGASPTIGGSSFSDAPLITAGSWTEQFVPGETIFYRVHLDWGQSLRLTVANPDRDFLQALFDANVYAPDRASTGAGSLGSTKANGTPDLVRATPAVLYANRTSASVVGRSSLAGDYYVSIGMPITTQEKDAGRLFPVTFRVDVEGSPHAAPDYVKPATANPSRSASASQSAGSATAAAKPPTARRADSSPAALVGGVLLTVAVIGGIAYAVWRRRAQGSSHE